MQRALTIVLAFALDLTLGDPPNRFHPVVLMGKWLNMGVRLAPRNFRFEFGLGWITAGILLFAAPWRIVEKLMVGKRGPIALRRREPRWFPVADQNLFAARPGLISHLPCTILSAGGLKSVFAYRNLYRRVAEVGEALRREELVKARHLLGRHLVSRDTDRLTADEVAGAAIESLAENITDSVVAPLAYYAIGGLPAAWAYRFINTADAMWGYRTEEFKQLGKFPARLDDFLNWIPARLTGWMFVMAAWLAGENTAQARRVMLSQHQRTNSPNAGWTMSATAGALGITLTKQPLYRLEGGSAKPQAATIYRALRLANICTLLSILLLICISVLGLFGKK